MKYMGSKKSMLENGLGKLIIRESQKANRFIDLFTGSANVSWFVAKNTYLPIHAIDLQRYSTILAESIICRTAKLDSSIINQNWIIKASIKRDKDPLWKKSLSLENNYFLNGHYSQIENFVNECRELCLKKSFIGPVWNSYGGFYFSPSQALTFDYLLKYLPKDPDEKTTCLSSCITSALECSASPGHTAQPFKPTERAGKYIIESWKRDPILRCQKSLRDLCPNFAAAKGHIFTGDALDYVQNINSNDLVFIDPPYSNVQYSRFYHVLETIAINKMPNNIFGSGRYPQIIDRPQSKFSNPSQSLAAFTELLHALAIKKPKIIITFPNESSSNGLSGEIIREISREWFSVNEIGIISSEFSTLGGNNHLRKARQKSNEMILLLNPLYN